MAVWLLLVAVTVAPVASGGVAVTAAGGARAGGAAGALASEHSGWLPVGGCDGALASWGDVPAGAFDGWRWSGTLASLGGPSGAGALDGALPFGSGVEHGGARTADGVDSGEPGPYAVGVTRRTFTRPSDSSGAARQLETVIWYPAVAEVAGMARDPQLGAVADAAPDRSAGPYPVVLYSHGSGGVPWGSSFLTTHLASHGFVVVAPPHPGNTLADCPYPCLPTNPAVDRRALLDAALNRPGDVIAAFDGTVALGAGADPLLAGLVDGSRVGVTGHSFGAETALRVASADPRFRAVVPMATADRQYLLDALPGINAPVMLFAGELDELARPEAVRRLYDHLAANGSERWLLVLRRAGHSTFTNRCLPNTPGCGPNDLPIETGHALIRRWVTPFLRLHVASDPRAALDPAHAAATPDLDVSYAPPGR